MRKACFPLATLTFQGPRFESAGLDVDVLPTILTYRKLLVEIARFAGSRDHTAHGLPPEDFERGITLKIPELRHGSVVVPIEREVTFQDAEAPHDPADEVQDAAFIIDEAIHSANAGIPPPVGLPGDLIGLLFKLGSCLYDGECLLIQANGREIPAPYSHDTREHIARWEQQAGDGADEEPLWKTLTEIGRSIPNDELEHMPRDGAENLDHYLYGSVREDE